MIDAVVTQDFLASHPDTVVVDIRWYLDGRSGRAAYRAAHVTGAVFIDLDEVLAGAPSPERGRHPLPDPAVFAEGMSAAGIGDDAVVVAYDDAGGVIAARLVWLLRIIGCDAALLDGGLATYEGETQAGDVHRARGRFTPRAWPSSALATIDEATGGNVLLIDARPRERFLGTSPDPVDPRSGHIPGARSVPCRENLTPEGRLHDRATLRDTYRAAGVTNADNSVVYCGSGVTACHNLLTMEWCGLGRGRLFPGSWSQYSHDPGRPVAVGE